MFSERSVFVWSRPPVTSAPHRASSGSYHNRLIQLASAGSNVAYLNNLSNRRDYPSILFIKAIYHTQFQTPPALLSCSRWQVMDSNSPSHPHPSSDSSQSYVAISKSSTFPFIHCSCIQWRWPWRPWTIPFTAWNSMTSLDRGVIASKSAVDSRKRIDDELFT